MKRFSIFMAALFITVGVMGHVAPQTAYADDEREYKGSGKWEKKWEDKWERKAQKGNHGRGNGRWSYYGGMYQYSNGYSYDYDRIAELLRLIEELKRQLQAQGGTVSGNDVTVSTRSATNIDEDEATLRGTLTIRDGNEADVWFEYGTNRYDLDEETAKETVDEDEDGDVSKDIDSLEDDTLYYFRIVGEGDDGKVVRGALFSFRTEDGNGNDEEPVAISDTPNDIDEDSAQLRGRIDMNDFENGKAFFVYGEHEASVSDVDDDFTTYDDVDEDGEDLKKVLVDSDVDGNETYAETVSNLDDNTRHYARMCVEYEKDNGDETLVCGSTRSFLTD